MRRPRAPAHAGFASYPTSAFRCRVGRVGCFLIKRGRWCHCLGLPNRRLTCIDGRRSRIAQRDGQLIRPRQLAEVPQSKLLEESGRCSIQQRTSHAFAAADDLDELTLVKRLQHLAAAHSANVLDFRAPNWLAVRDDCERLERCGGQPLRARGKLRALYRLREFGTSEYLPSARY